MNTDNQQEIGLEAHELGWLAGITDGEGCIALLVFAGRTNEGGTPRIQMRVTVANTNEAVVARIIYCMKKLDVGHHVQKQQCKSKGKDTEKTISLVHVSTKSQIYKFLKAIHPYLVDSDKRERARILLLLIEQRLAYCAENKVADNVAYSQADVVLILEFLQLTRSKQIDRLAAILNEQTREARAERQAIKRGRKLGHDVLWSHARV